MHDMNSQEWTHLKPTWNLGNWYPQSEASNGHGQLRTCWTNGKSASVHSENSVHLTAEELVSFFPACFWACSSTILLCVLNVPRRSSFHFISSSSGLSEVNGNKNLLRVLWNLF